MSELANEVPMTDMCNYIIVLIVMFYYWRYPFSYPLFVCLHFCHMFLRWCFQIITPVSLRITRLHVEQ